MNLQSRLSYIRQAKGFFVQTTTTFAMEPLSDAEAEAAIERLQEFLRFETISATAPDTGAYVECANFLKTQLQAIRNNITGESLLKGIHFLPEAPDHSPVVVAHWPSNDPSLPIGHQQHLCCNNCRGHCFLQKLMLLFYSNKKS